MVGIQCFCSIAGGSPQCSSYLDTEFYSCSDISPLHFSDGMEEVIGSAREELTLNVVLPDGVIATDKCSIAKELG